MNLTCQIDNSQKQTIRMRCVAFYYLSFGGTSVFGTSERRRKKKPEPCQFATVFMCVCAIVCKAVCRRISSPLFFLLLLVCKPTHSQPIRITGSVVGNTHSAVYISHATNSCLDMHRQQNRAVCVT